MWVFLVEGNLQVFYRLFIYVLLLEIQLSRVEDFRLFIYVLLLEIQLSRGEDFRLFIYVPLLEIQLSRGEDWIPLTGLTPPHFCACPKPGPEFPTSYVVGFFCVQ
jgi:hypothetical protein